MGDSYEKRTISADAARRLIAAAEAKAAELDKPFVTAVVDDDGVLKALSRMDGRPGQGVHRGRLRAADARVV